MRNILFLKNSAFCFAFLSALVWGAACQGAEITFPPGSRIGIVAPSGFSVSKAFKGFEDRDDKSVIVLFELPAAAYAQLEKSSSVEEAQKRGLAVEKREELTLPSGGKAVLFTGHDDSGGMKSRKWLMFAAFADFTAAINVQLPEDPKGKYSEQAIRAALDSVATRNVPDGELLGLLPFKISDLQNFKIAEVAENRTIVIADDPKDNGATASNSYMILSAAQAPTIEPEERGNVARQALGGLTAYKDMKVTFAEPMRLGGQQGYELRVDAKHVKSGADVAIVQWMRFGTGAVLRIIGVAPKEKWAESFPRFRAVRDSVSAH